MRMGIIGTGRIASRFAETVVKEAYAVFYENKEAFEGAKTASAGNEGVKLCCVYNPHIESARKFCAAHGIESYTDNLTVFLENIDAAYIASPHETHYEYSLFLLNNGKHVLCEKPAALCAEQTRKLCGTAKEKGLVFMEAVKTAYCPGFKAMMKLAQSGKIGRIVDVEAAFSRLTPVNTREYEAPLYNGSFLEFGSYVMLPVFKLLGCGYSDVSFASVRAQNGVDAYTKAYFSYDGAMAEVKTGLGVKTEGQLLISGTNGYILAKSPWWLTREFEVRYENPNKREVYDYEYDGSGLQYELKEFVTAVLRAGNTEGNGGLSSEMGKREQEKCILPENAGLTDCESIAMSAVMEKFLKWNKPQLEKMQQEFINAANTKPMPKVWAHRGCSTRFPENTLEAFRAAAELDGITGIEFDVQLSADGVPVVFHDENIKRVIGVDKTIASCTLEELKSFSIAAGNGKTAAIPTLEETLSLLKPYCEEKGLLINIELKTSIVRYEGIEKKAYELVKSFEMERYIVWSSFLAESVEYIRKLAPQAETAVLAGSNEECITMARQTGASALHPYIGGLVFKLPEDMKDMPVRAWNGEEPFFGDARPLREPQLDRYRAYGATDIFTNMPERYLNRV